MTKARLARVLAGAIAVIGWSALGLQLNVLLVHGMADGLSLFAILSWFFTFFSIQTNILAAAVASAAAIGARNFLAGDSVRAAAAVYLVIVGAVFFLLLRNDVPWQGLQGIANVLLHYVTPPLYVLFWLVLEPKSSLRWRNAAMWLIYPLAYLAFVLLQAQKSGFYPYPFLDLRTLGVVKWSLNVVMLAAAFAGVSLLTVAIGRLTTIGRISD